MLGRHDYPQSDPDWVTCGVFVLVLIFIALSSVFIALKVAGAI